MVKRWGLLQRPITISIHNIRHLVCSIGVLHNFCINEQIIQHGGIGIFCPKNTNFCPDKRVLHNTAAEFGRANLVYKFAMAHSNLWIYKERWYRRYKERWYRQLVTLSSSILKVNASTHPYPQLVCNLNLCNQFMVLSSFICVFLLFIHR